MGYNPPLMLPEIPPGVSPTFYYLCVSLAVLLIAVSKGGFGGGIGIISVPLTIMVMPPTTALGFMLPILIVADIFSWFHHRTGQAKLHLRWLLVGCMVGIVAATVLLAVLGRTTNLDQSLTLLVGVLCLLMVLAQVYRMIGGSIPRLPHTPMVGYVSGGTAGFLSTLAQSAGPITNVYLLEMGFNKSVHVSTSVLFYLVNNIAKVPFYLLLSYLYPADAYFTWANAKMSLLFMPLIPLGTWTGAWLHHKMDEKPFNVVMYVGAALAAGWMIYKAAFNG